MVGVIIRVAIKMRAMGILFILGLEEGRWTN